MAKRTYKLDPYGFSEMDFEMDGFDFDKPKKVPKNKREAVMDFGKGFVSGVGSTAKSPSFIKQIILKSLPKGFEDTANFIDTNTSSLKDAYRDSVKEMKPAINDLKRITNRVLPSVEQKMPRKLADTLKAWSKPKVTDTGLSAENQQEMALQMQLGEIFKYQVEADLKGRNEDRAKGVINAGIDNSRHRDIVGQLNDLRISFNNIVSYNTKVGSAIQRKSLELQFRHFYLAQESLLEQKKQNSVVTQHLDGILKNTGLPDYVKLTKSENLKQLMFNKFADSDMVSRGTDFFKRLIGNIGKKAKDTVRDAASTASMGLGAIDRMLDMSEMNMSNDSWQSKAGKFAGEQATKYGGTKLGKKAASMLSAKNKARLGKMSNKLEYATSGGLSGDITSWANGEYEVDPNDKSALGKINKLLSGGGFLGGLGDILKQSVKETNNKDNKLMNAGSDLMMQPAVFNNRNAKSVDEIIPGYLARIFRELQVIRTGDDSIGLTLFDYSSGKFADKKTVAQKILDAVLGDSAGNKSNKKNQIEKLEKKKNSKFSKLTKEEEETLSNLKRSLDKGSSYTSNMVNELVDSVDTDKTLSKEQKEILGQFLLNRQLKGGSGDFSKLSDKKVYTGKAGTHADVFSNIFKSQHENDAIKGDSSKQLKFSNEFNNVYKYTNDGRKEIQDFTNLGYKDILEEIGLINSEDNSINLDTLYEYYFSKDKDVSKLYPSESTDRKSRRSPLGRNRNRGNQNANSNSNYKKEALPPKPGMVEEDTSKQETRELNFEPIIKATDDILKEIKETNSKSTVETISDTLLRIENRVNQGIIVAGQIVDKDGKVPWYKMSVGSAIGGTAKGIGKLAMSAGNTLRDAVSSTFNAGKSILGAGFGIASTIGKFGFNKIADKLLHLRDVYVPGEEMPRMTVVKIKAGYYFDKLSGKVIKSYRDISGPVVDSEGTTILDADEVKTAYVKYGIIKKTITALGAGIGKLFKLGNTLAGYIPPVIRFAFNIAKSIFNFTFFRAEDVYVHGKEDPVLLAVTMKAGGYTSKITGKLIKSPHDIDGPVLDKDGNIVLTKEELAAGLLNNKGRPLRVGLGKLTGLIKDVIGTASKVVSKTFKTAKNIVTGTAKGIGKFLMHGVDGFRSDTGKISDNKLSGDELTVKRITEIRDILLSRLPKPKRIRKGSYDDISSSLKKKLLPTATDGKPNTQKSLGGMLMSGIGSLFGFGKKKDNDGDSGSVVGDMAEDYAEMKFMDKAGAWGKNLWGKTKGLGKKGLGKMGWKGKALSAVEEGVEAVAKTGKSGSLLSKGSGLLGKGANLLGKSGGLLAKLGLSGGTATSLLGKLALPLAALTSVYSAGTDLKGVFSGKTNMDTWNKNNGKFGLGTALNPWEAGKYVGAKYNEKVLNPMMQFATGDKNATLGTALYDGVEKLTNALTGKKDDTTNTTTKDQINAYRKKMGKPPLADNVGTIAKPGTNGAAKEIAKELKNNIAENKDGLKVSGSANVVMDNFKPLDSTIVDELTAVRFKAYGLVEMESSKVRALSNLERVMSGGMNFDKAFKADWKGDIVALGRSMMSSFGISEIENPDGKKWTSWFNLRFLPVYLNYASVVCSYKKKADKDVDVSLLSDQDKIEVANAIIATRVWSVNATPWPGYEVNNSPDSTSKNIENLKAKAKDIKLTEKKSTTDIGVEKQTSSTAAKGGAVNNSAKTWWDNVADTAGSVWDKTKKTVSDTYKSAVDSTSKAIEKAANITGLGPQMPSAPAGSGRQVDAMGAGAGGQYTDLALPKGDGSYSALKELISNASKMVGVDEKLMATMAAIESGFRSTVKAGTSSATGLYQFISSTWNTMIKKYGPKYGIPPGTSPSDPRANALMGAEFIKENANALKGVKKGELTDTDLYLAHFLGAGGAKKLLSADPNADATQLMPAPARANSSIFYNKDSSPRTVSQVYDEVNRRVRSKGKQFGLDSGSATQMLAANDSANKPASTSTSGTTPDQTTSPTGTASPQTQSTASTPDTTSSTRTPTSENTSSKPQSIPVSNQTPGIQTQAVPAGTQLVQAKFTPEQQTNIAKPTPVNNDIQRSNDLVAQKQYQTESGSNSFGVLSDTLSKSVNIQQSQYDILVKIYSVLAENIGKVNTSKSDDSVQSSDPKSQDMNNKNIGGSKPMTSAPVSMKRVFA